MFALNWSSQNALVFRKSACLACQLIIITRLASRNLHATLSMFYLHLYVWNIGHRHSFAIDIQMWGRPIYINKYSIDIPN